uniref:Uncharacterized protein n=1 Tax=Glossina morsitans morsitans TaxID=37546 RepID=A0A1B0FE81_GLOMM
MMKKNSYHLRKLLRHKGIDLSRLCECNRHPSFRQRRQESEISQRYRDSSLKNKSSIKGKNVLHVVCGTAISSTFVSQTGANKVVGIDNSEIIYNAIGIIRALPQENMIVSEWMGYFLLFESMIDKIIYARDKHLASQGKFLPNRCIRSVVGYGDDELII